MGKEKKIRNREKGCWWVEIKKGMRIEWEDRKKKGCRILEGGKRRKWQYIKEIGKILKDVGKGRKNKWRKKKREWERKQEGQARKEWRGGDMKK